MRGVLLGIEDACGTDGPILIERCVADLGCRNDAFRYAISPDGRIWAFITDCSPDDFETSLTNELRLTAEGSLPCPSR